MKISIALAAIGVFALTAASHSEYKTEEKETVQHTFSKDNSLDIDNVNGTITVTGDAGNTIRVEGEKIIRALDQAELQKAKRAKW